MNVFSGVSRVFS